MLDPLWLLLLLPIAAGSGWYTARRELTAARKSTSFHLPSAYFTGLNFLLNEQTDKAIEVFVKVLEVDSETVEMHLTLGSLFRRRGEVERATRIHQNIIARPTLSESQRMNALFELAQDYFKAGLFDRAESLFLDLADVPAHAEQALYFLSQVYEQEKEWDRAIEVLQRFTKYSEKDFTTIIAQYHCELADIKLQENEFEKAGEHINKALAIDPGCTRATIQKGDLAFGSGDYGASIRSWREIEAQDPRYLGEVIDKLVVAYREIGDNQGMDEFLHKILHNYGGAKLLKAQIDDIELREGAESAARFLAQWLHDHPSLYGLRRLVALKKDDTSNGFSGEIAAMQTLLVNLFDTDDMYRCKHCGFTGRSLHWQCPGCKRWQTQEPLGDEQVIRQAS